MKNYIRLLIILIGLLTSSLVYAKDVLRIQISGISGPVLQNALDRLKAIEVAYGHDLTPPEIEKFYQNAPTAIKKAIEPFGYFRSEVYSHLTHHGTQWQLYFTVIPGQPLRITYVDIEISGPGKLNSEIQHYVDHFPLRPGQVLNMQKYDEAKASLFQTVNNQGYLKAALEQKEIRINLQNDTATIILHMQTGFRYYFGSVHFSPTPFAPQFLNRLVSIPIGEPFSSQKLLKIQQDLGNSHYFKEVTVSPEINNAQDFKVPVTIFASVPKSQQYNIGVGYGTFTGPRLTLGTDLRRTTNTGQHFNAEIKISSVLSGLAAKYYIPGKNPLTDQYTLGANAQKFVPKNGKSISETLSASYVKNVNVWQHNLTASLLSEHYKVNDQPSQSSHFLYPSYSISRIQTDNPLHTTSGSVVNFTIQGASEHIASTTSFLQMEIKGKYIFSPNTVSRVIVRGDLGYTAVNDLLQLPLTLRFFAGGLGSIRGYPYSTIGPGRFLETASVEYQHKIYGDWSGSIFYDAGTATNHFNDYIYRGAGVGVIYNSFIGAIQLYVARAESLRGKPLRVEFSMGPDI